MVTLKFTTEKANKQLIFIPTVGADYSDKAKNATVEIYLCWLNGALCISISWTHKAKNGAANGISDGAKYY